MKHHLALMLPLAIALSLSFSACLSAADGDGAPPALEVDPLDWPTWRGPEQNGVSRETGLIDSWNPRGGEGSNLLWQSEELAGRSTPIVMRGKLYKIVRSNPGTPEEGERVVCVDAATGEFLWENSFNVYLSDVPDFRVGWSSCVGDPTTGRIYVQAVCGTFLCIDGETGETLWSHSLHEKFGALSTYGGRTNVPLIFEDLVIISAVVIGWGDTPQTGLMAKPAHRFMAFNKLTGEIVWFNGTRLIPYDTTYSTPVVTTLGGQAALVFGSGDGAVWALQPRTGKQLWKYQFSRRGVNVSPLVVDDVVYMGHSEENPTGNRMGGFVAIDGRGSGDLTNDPLWRLNEMMVGKSSPIMIDGRVYAVDDGGSLLIFDAETGDLIARKKLGAKMRSSLLYADGKIYAATHDSRWYILEPTETGVSVLHRIRLPGNEEVDASPIVSHGRIYLSTNQHLYCIGTEGAEPAATPRPTPPAETPLSQDTVPAQIQIVPCDVLLRPGEEQQFTIRLFNARGQFLGETTEGSFALTGPGEVTDSGNYIASGETAHTATMVNYTVGDVTGTARVRVVPPLPWAFDFDEEDDVPLTWIGGRVRYVLREVDGERIMAKRDEIPTRPGQDPTKLGTRSRLWMGQDDLSDYTIQADVQGQVKDNKMPDLGLINQRYTMDLKGASQQLELRTWGTVLRMAETIPYEWQPGEWYTMKMSVTLEDGNAIVHGKIWPRDSEEPAEWTLTATDPSPNLTGAPGLWGITKDAEFYMDNITVTKN
ncbi:MAG: PQQ-binding-like beta-propeller repeat protein [Thermoguttaceae bacterium]